MTSDPQPYIPASQSLPEFTLRALILGLILSLVMCAANIYVGLYAGMTICTVLITAALLLAVGYTGEAGLLADMVSLAALVGITSYLVWTSLRTRP